MRLRIFAPWVVCAALLAAVTAPLSAQVYTGRIEVTVVDGTGAVLPGALVEISGPQNASAPADQKGVAQFLNLAPGTYKVVAKLSGFNDYTNDNVPVGVGVTVPLKVTLGVGAVATDVTVLAESPVVDPKRTTQHTNVTLAELQEVPSSRDPWVVLQTVPGIVVDRVNVGGAESGQQSNYQAKGAAGTDNTWNMDGIAITDMAALGASPTYYDFDMFQEMQVTTGGSDVSNPTPGVHLNFVLRGGTNMWRGSGRYYFEDDSMQSDNLSSDLAGELFSYNRLNTYRDFGGEGGGPLIKNRLFAWGAYGKTEPKMRIFSFNSAAGAYLQTAKDETILENYAAKVNAEITNKSRFTFAFFRGDKQKFGRGAGAQRPDETTYNQAGPTDLYKFELNQTIGSNLFLVGRYAKTNGGFSLEPRGGRDANVYRDDDGVYHNSFGFYATDRPQDNVSLDGNFFKGRHELKFGFGWRKAAVTSESGWAGGMVTTHNGYPSMDVTIVRNWAAAGEGIYTSAYFGDTITYDRLTLNLGLRWGRAQNNILAASAPANPHSDLLPALTATPADDVISFSLVTPRAGFSYALDENRRTILRGSYAMFTSQLNAVLAATTVSQIPAYSYVYYTVTDTNGNRVADPAEIAAGTFAGTYGFDPENPLDGNANQIGDYTTPRTHEVLFGVDHELFRNFGVSAAFTWRRMTNFNWTHYRGITGSDFIPAGVLEGTAPGVGSFSQPFFVVDSDAFPADFGQVYEKRDGYSQRYWGVELAATKRMSDRWMLRLGWSTNAHREYFDSIDAMEDPTPTVTTAVANPNKDGGLVMTPTTGSGKGSIFVVLPKYQFIATSAYQWRWGINFGMNYVLRQGYSEPFFRSRTPGSVDETASVGKNVLIVDDIDDFRLPSVHSFDARVGKRFDFGRFNANVDFDIFNLFNSSTVLSREYDLRLSTFNVVKEIMNPRILRIGVRFGI